MPFQCLFTEPARSRRSTSEIVYYRYLMLGTTLVDTHPLAASSDRGHNSFTASTIAAYSSLRSYSRVSSTEGKKTFGSSPSHFSRCGLFHRHTHLLWAEDWFYGFIGTWIVLRTASCCLYSYLRLTWVLSSSDSFD